MWGPNTVGAGVEGRDAQEAESCYLAAIMSCFSATELHSCCMKSGLHLPMHLALAFLNVLPLLHNLQVGGSVFVSHLPSSSLGDLTKDPFLCLYNPADR